MRSSLRTILAMATLAACGKSAPKEAPSKAAAPVAATPTTKPTATAAPTAVATATATGVEPGAVTHDASEGPAAVVKSIDGSVQIQRLGETTRVAAKLDDKLYAGDRVITGDESLAVIGMADTSVVEVSESSALAIASRAGTADPASAVAVLAGVARFSVATRAPGEGPFRVYTPAGMIVTHGTVYGVGVDAAGDARVSVESGVVDVFGIAGLDRDGSTVKAGSSADLDASGTVGSAITWPHPNDWGAWRDHADASLDLGAAIDAHAAAMAGLELQLASTYTALDATAADGATFEAAAAAEATANDPAAYKAALPDGSATLEASFDLGERAEALTWANAAHGQLAADLYVRNPDIVGPHWAVVSPHVDAALMWPKRFEVTAVGYLEPLRLQYYVHHPVGRVHAPFVGVTVPPFYAAVTPPPLSERQVRAHAHVAVWLPTRLDVVASARPIWIAAPSPDWAASAEFVAPIPTAHAELAWYVRPPQPHFHAIVGMPVTGEWHSGLAVGVPAPRVSLGAAWQVPVGVHVHIEPPDIQAGIAARAAYGVHAGASAGVGVASAVRTDVRSDVHAVAKVRVQVPSVKIKVKLPSVKIRGGAGFSIH